MILQFDYSWHILWVQYTVRVYTMENVGRQGPGNVSDNCQSVDVHLRNVPRNEYRQGVRCTHNKERLPKCA